MNLHNVAPQLDSMPAVRRKSSPTTEHKRRQLLAILKSYLPVRLAVVIPVLGLMAVAMPAANAQYSIFNNQISDTDPSAANPYTNGQGSATNLSVSGIGRGAGLMPFTFLNGYSASGWTEGPLEETNFDYFNWTMTPAPGYALDLTNFVYTGAVSGGTPTFNYRSSLEGTTNLGTPTASGANIGFSTAYQNLQSAVTFRLYGSNFANAATTYSVNDFTYNGLVSNRWNGSSGDLSTGAKYLSGLVTVQTNGIQFETPTTTAVNVDTPTTIAGIRFAAGAGAFTLSGNPITLGSAGGIANYSTNLQTINSNLVLTATQTTSVNTLTGDITLGGVISSTGSATFNKNGPGTLIVGGSNTITGGTTNLNGGLTKIAPTAGTALPFGSSSVNLALGATLDLNGVSAGNFVDIIAPGNALRGTITNTGAGTATLSRAYTNNSTLTIDGTAGITFANTYTGTAGNLIVKNGTNTLRFEGSSNNASLALTVNNGVVSLAKGSANGRAVNGPVIVNGGIVRLNGTGGDQILNDVSAPVTLIGGALDVLANETLTGVLQIGNGTLNGSVTGSATLSNNTTVSAQSGSVSGILGGPAGLTKTTGGTVNLSGANTYIGTTTVSAGTLQVANPKALGFGGTTGLGVTSAGTTVTAGGTLDISGQSSVLETITLNGTGFDGNGALINMNATASVVGGGVATLTLLTGGAGYTGTTPTVTITGGGGTPGSATATLTRGVTAATWTITPNGATYSAPPILTITGGNGTGATAIANLDGSGLLTGITITNPGTGFFSNPTLAIADTNRTGGSVPTVAPNSTNFQISGITLISGGTGFTSAPTVTISGATTTATALGNLPTIILASTSSIGGTGNITVNSAISESATASGLTKVGSNTVTLTAPNTYTGPTTINAGTLKLTTTTTNNVPTTSQIVLGGGTLDVTSVSGGSGFALASNQILSGAGTVSGSLTAGSTNEIRPGGTGVAGTLNFGALALNGSSMTFDLGTSSDLINLGLNTLTGSGTNLFTLNNLSGFGAGTYTLIDYGTKAGGVGLSNFALSSPTLAGFNVELADNGSAIVLNVSAIPEPSTLVLGGLALLGFAGAGLRRRRKVA